MLRFQKHLNSVSSKPAAAHNGPLSANDIEENQPLRDARRAFFDRYGRGRFFLQRRAGASVDASYP
jgi:hypothetical protein